MPNKKPAMTTNNNHYNGQALVEFALILGVLLLIVIGGLKIGLAIMTSQVMNNVADAGAFRVSVGDSDTQTMNYMQTELQKKMVNPDTVSMFIACQPAGCDYGSLATVTITKTFTIRAVLWQIQFPVTAQASAIVQKGH